MVNIFKFNFTAPIHIGTVKSEMDSSDAILHSDSLYAAMVHAWVRLGGATSDIADEQGNPKGFTLSSLFPYFRKKEGGDILFFPLPKGVKLNSGVDRKKAEKIKFIDLPNFKQLQQAGFLNIAASAMHNRFLTAEEKFNSRFMEAQVYPRVQVPRIGGEDALPYYLERIFFSKGSGFHCLVHFTDESVKPKILAALRYLGDEGLGTDRHVGNGHYELEVDENDYSGLFEGGHGYKVNLSMFCPGTQEELVSMLKPACAYAQPVKRGGWLSRDGYLSYRKGTVYMFREGGIFYYEKNTGGKTVDLRPPKEIANIGEPVWRCGKSLFVPIARNTN